MTRLPENESGAVLITVIVITIVLSVIVISLMSVNVGHVKTSQTVIDEIKAEYMAESQFHKFHQEMYESGTNSLDSLTNLLLGDKAFVFDGIDTADIDTPGNTLRLTFNISF